MSFNKKFLQDITTLKNLLKSEGSERFYFIYVKKADAYVGSSESIKFIDKFVEKYLNTSEEFYTIDQPIS